MHRAHSPQKASEIAHRAIATIEGLGMVPHPDNFLLWYRYISGDCPPLNQALDRLVESKSLTEEEGARLRSEFLDTAADASEFERFAVKLQSEVAVVLSLIDEAGRGTNTNAR